MVGDALIGAATNIGRIVMPDSIGHHRRYKAGREVKVSAAYLGGLAVSDKHGTVVTSANTTRTTGRTARIPMRS